MKKFLFYALSFTWGLPVTPIVSIPSAVRYHYRLFLVRVVGVTRLPSHDAIWFKGQATRWGEKFMKTFEKEN